jgi:SecD/SecF fusion protein
MQNKGVIRLFAIVFALACLYQLSFTLVSNNVADDAAEYANGDYAKEQRYLDSIGNEKVSFLGLGDWFTYEEVREKEINLGLDLRGGMNVILEVQVKDILASLANDKNNPVLVEALQRASALQTENQDDYLTSFFEAFESVKKEKSLAIKLSDPALFGTKEMNDKLGFNADDEAVQNELRAEADAAVSNVYTVLRARIDQSGVVQPNIQKLENNGGRILVELPGVKDPDRMKKLLQSTAELEFYTLYDGAELIGFLNQANEKLKTIVERPASLQATGDSSATQKEVAPENVYDIDAIDETEDTAKLAAQEGAEGTSEVDSLLGGTDSTAAAFNPLYDVLFPNVNQQGQVGAGPIVGFSLVKDTAKVNAYLANAKVRALLSGNMRNTLFFWTVKPNEGGYLMLLAAKVGRDQRPELTGDVVTDARQDFDNNNRAIVNMTMNATGAAQWQKITREASKTEPKKSVAVVLDGYAYSYPTVQNEISGGRTQIFGNFTVEEAQDLANILKAGKLPAPARIVQADIVGPSLGQEAINAGLWSFIVALAIVLLYMIFYYSGAGVASNVALIVNMFFIFGVLAGLGAVLTLPGIAGIVLTIGMAVDANVLIYERIREELTHGKGLRLAIKDGYSNAYSSIIDANVTTFLTGVILYAFGTGPIRGFATTLIIGILTSLFCAIFITRLLFEWQMGRKKVVTFSTNLTKGAFSKVNIDFIGKRKISYTISGIIIVLGIVSLATRGLNYGVDFVGGRSYQVRFDQNVSSTEIESALAKTFVAEDGTSFTPNVKIVGEDNQVLVTTKFRISESGPEVEEDIKGRLYEGVKGFYSAVPTMEDFASEAGESSIGIVAERQVGPTIADDIKTSAVYAILFSLIVIFLYILFRFSKWQFSLGAVAAAFHDVLVVLSIFSIAYGFLPFSLEIDQAFIAAVLTVIGYSLNDTVVVFDRIREYLRENSKNSVGAVVNKALNSTLSRTINTSLTTFFVLLIIFLFGGEVIRGFMFALLIGIVVGTYSSLFIATPIMLDTLSKKDKEIGS